MAGGDLNPDDDAVQSSVASSGPAGPITAACVGTIAFGATVGTIAFGAPCADTVGTFVFGAPSGDTVDAIAFSVIVVSTVGGAGGDGACGCSELDARPV